MKEAAEFVHRELAKIAKRKPITWLCFKCGKRMDIQLKDQHKCEERRPK